MALRRTDDNTKTVRPWRPLLRSSTEARLPSERTEDTGLSTTMFAVCLVVVVNVWGRVRYDSVVWWVWCVGRGVCVDGGASKNEEAWGAEALA